MFIVGVGAMGFGIAHGSVEFCVAAPSGLADESKESINGRDTDRDLRSAPRHVDASRDLYFYFLRTSSVRGGGGEERCKTFSFIMFSLFSRPLLYIIAGLATLKSVFFRVGEPIR